MPSKAPTVIRPPWRLSGRNNCFGCSKTNPAGLALEMVDHGEEVVCDFELTARHESYPGLIHGGVSAAVLDEVMGNLLVHRERKVCFTTGLKITYAGALRIGGRYRAAAWLKDRPEAPDGVYRVVGEIRDSADTALVMARATFQWMTVGEWRRALERPGEPNEELLPFLRSDPPVVG